MRAINEKELIYLAIEEFYFKGRTSEHIARVLHLPLDTVTEEVKNIVFSPYYGR